MPKTDAWSLWFSNLCICFLIGSEEHFISTIVKLKLKARELMDINCNFSTKFYQHMYNVIHEFNRDVSCGTRRKRLITFGRRLING